MHDSPTVADDGAPRSAGSPISALLASAGSQRVGPYSLVSVLGEGGCGTVYLAERHEPIYQRVALKLIKLGMDTRQVVARFEQERQALAMMDHPNIAKVFDAGATEAGRPYFVMEYVRGPTITAYADSQRLTITQRLELLAMVCEAVQHAHTKGIIHRDLKPSNILIELVPGPGDEPRAVPKVIDFGIAKAVRQRLSRETLCTERGQLIGTPEYMSPEQADPGVLDVDTRADVYSLGMVLYELLTGVLPFDPATLRGATYSEMQRLIRDAEPPRPSSRLGSLASPRSPGGVPAARSAVAVASQRRTDARTLLHTLRRELEWIPLKALRKDREHRYRSAQELADDLRNYVQGRPLLAGPESGVYRTRKFIRRHRAAVIAGLAVALTLVLGAIGTTIGLVSALRERSRAQAEATSAIIVAEFVSDLLAGAGPSIAGGRDTALLKDLMDTAARRIERGELAQSPQSELRLRGTVGDVYRQLAQYDAADRILRPTLDLALSLHGADSVQHAVALNNMAHLQWTRGDLAGAEPALREALDTRRRLLGSDHPKVAESLNNLASLLQTQGNFDDAERLFREALDLRRRLFGAEHEDVAQSIANLGQVLKLRGSLTDAEPLLREALVLRRRLFGDVHPSVATNINNLANLLVSRREYAEAEPLLREALATRRRIFGDNHMEVAASLNSLSNLLREQGQTAEAIDLLQQSLRINRQVLGPRHPGVALILNNIATLLPQQADGQAEAMLREALDIRREARGPDHPDVAQSMNNLARLLRVNGKLAEADTLYREAMQINDRVYPAAHWLTGNSRLGLGITLTIQRRYQEAEPLLLEAERVLGKADGVPAGRYAQAVAALVDLYGQWDAAEPGAGHARQTAHWQARQPAPPKP